MKKTKALALLSGGLDSTLAVKLVLDQGLIVEAIDFVTPFCLCRKGGCGASEAAQTFNIPLKVLSTGKEYLNIIRNPKFGYGRNMSPCIDCRIFMLKKAKKYAKDIGETFIFTGEVLGQRPMSQHRKAMDIIEREAGLQGKILRPLSGKLLPVTEAEKNGLVDRDKLMGVKGRSRKKQIEMIKETNLLDYPCPSGGCLLTYKEFANKLRDLFEHKKRVSLKDVSLLKVGRHFRFGKNKIVVGRNKAENEVLLKIKPKNDYYLEVPNYGRPITILQGPKTRRAIEQAACLTAFYSDRKSKKVIVKFGKDNLHKSMIISSPSSEQVKMARIA
jgi:tRNA U34 2-thiouridine synthase MnmA/TrmU